MGIELFWIKNASHVQFESQSEQIASQSRRRSWDLKQSQPTPKRVNILNLFNCDFKLKLLLLTIVQ